MLKTAGCCREAGLVRTPWNSASGALTTDGGVSAWLDRREPSDKANAGEEDLKTAVTARWSGSAI
jgi:hypothetical protein